MSQGDVSPFAINRGLTTFMSRTTIDRKKIEKLDPLMVKVLRALTPAQRLAIAFDCNRTMCLRLAAHLQFRHPDWSDVQVNAEIAARMLRGSS